MQQEAIEVGMSSIDMGGPWVANLTENLATEAMEKYNIEKVR
jgi:hypothetical protein